MGTALGAALLIGIMAVFVYREVVSFQFARSVAIGAVIGIVLVGVAFAWRLMNKPRNVDFLIATDAEMKKVNWTSRQELIGSTKIVILFMFAIAAALFLIDVLTGLFFQIIGLLKVGPLS
jgi:preprotein translocase SecE subunit